MHRGGVAVRPGVAGGGDSVADDCEWDGELFRGGAGRDGLARGEEGGASSSSSSEDRMEMTPPSSRVRTGELRGSGCGLLHSIGSLSSTVIAFFAFRRRALSLRIASSSTSSPSELSTKLPRFTRALGRAPPADNNSIPHHFSELAFPRDDTYGYVCRSSSSCLWVKKTMSIEAMVYSICSLRTFPIFRCGRFICCQPLLCLCRTSLCMPRSTLARQIKWTVRY